MKQAMTSGMGMSMSMTIEWTSQCIFLFETFHTQHVITFLVGCVISFFIAGLTVALPVLKQKFFPELIDHYSRFQTSEQSADKKAQMKNKIKLFIYYLIYSLVHIVNMLIIMTLNFWVLLFVLAGVGVSFYFFCSQKKCCH